MNNTYTFHVNGMHCNACELMIDSDLCELNNVTNVKASLKKREVRVSGDFGTKTDEEIAAELTQVIKPRGYSLSVTKVKQDRSIADFTIAIPLAFGFIALFYLLQRMGIVNLVDTQNVSYGTAFVVGIIASLSTCMAVVGGLILSMSASFAKSGDKIRPQVTFHISRIIAFFILGGVIGAVGSAFSLNSWGTFILSLLIGLIMLILGLNLLDIFHWSKKLQPSMPKFISKHVLGISKFNHRFTPILVGMGTFFLPCGFTQSMQIFTLSTGSFLSGGLTMLAFALGTLPILALISFSSFSIQNSPKIAGIFFKTAGLIVLMFALFNIINSLVAVGWIQPVFKF